MSIFSNIPKLFFDLPTHKNIVFNKEDDLITSTFTDIHGENVLLKLTNTHIYYYQNYKDSMHSSLEGQVLLNLNLSYEINKKSAYQHVFQKGDQQNKLFSLKLRRKSKEVLQIFTLNENEIMQWKNILIQKVSCFGFHNKYKMTVKIGKGTFSQVHHAIDIQTKEHVAVKSVKKSVINENDEKRQLFETQIRILRKLNHPNVIKMIGVYQSDNSLYVIMKLVKGGQLYYKIQSNQKFKPMQIKSFLKKVLLGLYHIHNQGIIHRDIKPQNILFTNNNEPVIVDFGFATQSYNNHRILYKCGTIGYMAPEILKLKSSPNYIDPVCDVFSLGVIFYMMLFGQSPFLSKSSISLIRQGVSWTPDLIQLCQNQFTTGTIDLLTKMLDQNPMTRISSQQALSHPYFSQQNFTMKQIHRNQQQDAFERRRNLSLNTYIRNGQNRMSPEGKIRYIQKKLKYNNI